MNALGFEHSQMREVEAGHTTLRASAWLRLYSFPHLVQEIVIEAYVSVNTSTESDSGFVFSVVVGPTGRDQLEFPTDPLVFRCIGRGVFAVEDFEALQAGRHQFAYQRFEFAAALGKPNGMRERRQTASLDDAPDPFFEGRFVTLDSGFGFIGQIAVERFLKAGHVSLFLQYAREVGPADLVATIDLNVGEADVHSELVQPGDEVRIALAAAGLLRFEPGAEPGRGRARERKYPST